MPGPGPKSSHELLRAAQYVRMSTEHQQYSTENQSAAIALYAAAQGMGIVRSYVDAGKSGLQVKGRKAIQDLIATVQSGQADFRYILVYDVSRWGRFQDADEAAHYEYLCKRAGIQIRYCAEQFDNDNSSIANLLKALKRTMAGEYSRELSVKVFTGLSRLASLGFNLGGPTPYGLRRLLLDSDGRAKQTLQAGQRKSIHTDRVVLVPGPEEEIRVVREVFDLCTKRRRFPRQIAEMLNSRGLRSPNGRLWDPHVVEQMLSNPKYTGANVWARRTQKLGSKLRFNPQQQWVVKKDAFTAIVSPQQFERVQRRLRSRRPRYTDVELLEILRAIWSKHGTLSLQLLQHTRGAPSVDVYADRFGGLRKAYEVIGFKTKWDYRAIWNTRARAKEARQRLLDDIICQCQGVGASVTQLRSGIFKINQEFGLAAVVIPFRHWKTRTKGKGWYFKISFGEGVDVLLAARLDMSNEQIADYYLIPRLSGLRGYFWAYTGADLVFLEAYRSQDLQPLRDAVARRGLPEMVGQG